MKPVLTFEMHEDENGGGTSSLKFHGETTRQEAFERLCIGANQLMARAAEFGASLGMSADSISQCICHGAETVPGSLIYHTESTPGH